MARSLLRVSLRMRNTVQKAVKSFTSINPVWWSLSWRSRLCSIQETQVCIPHLLALVSASWITCHTAVLSTGTVGDKVRAFWKSVGVWLPWNQWQGSRPANALLLGRRRGRQWWLWEHRYVSSPFPCSRVVSARPGIPRISSPLHGLHLLFPPGRHKLWAVKQALWFLWTFQVKTVQVHRGNPI